MYHGSAAFDLANGKDIQKQKIRGTIGNLSFDGSNVLGGSMTITDQISDQADSKIGSVFIGKLTCTFLNNLTVPARSWRNKKITVEFGLCITENPDTYEYFKVGEFYVSEAKVSADGVSITAYNAMSFFDQPLPANYTLSGSPFTITKNICDLCGVPLGMVEADFRLFPNGQEPLGAYVPNDCVTYRDLIYWISVTLGGWATIDRNGRLIYGTYYRENDPVATITPGKRVAGATFSDWITDFGAATFENDDGTVEELGGGGLTYQVGFDPFLQYGTPEHRTEMRMAVYLAISNIRFMPFKLQLISAPVFDLGDIVLLTGGVADGRQHIGCIQSISWTASKGLTIAGFGADPNLRNTQTEKEASNSAAQRATAASEMVYKEFTNISPITVVSDPAQVVNIDFTANKKTNVEMWHEFLIETQLATGQTSMTIEAVYYMDGVEQTRKPVETFTDSAKHILDLHYFYYVDEPGSHTWEVFLEATGGTAAINSRDAFAVLKGQGLSNVDSWTGIIILDDDVPRFAMDISVRGFSDTVEFREYIPERIEVSENAPRPAITLGTRPFSADVSLVLQNIVFGIVSENGLYNIVSEDNNYNLVSED